MDYRTPSGRPVEIIRPAKQGRPIKLEPVPVTAEFEHRKTEAEIANERFLAALDTYFKNGGRA